MSPSKRQCAICHKTFGGIVKSFKANWILSTTVKHYIWYSYTNIYVLALNLKFFFWYFILRIAKIWRTRCSFGWQKTWMGFSWDVYGDRWSCLKHWAHERETWIAFKESWTGKSATIGIVATKDWPLRPKDQTNTTDEDYVWFASTTTRETSFDNGSTPWADTHLRKPFIKWFCWKIRK